MPSFWLSVVLLRCVGTVSGDSHHGGSDDGVLWRNGHIRDDGSPSHGALCGDVGNEKRDIR